MIAPTSIPRVVPSTAVMRDNELYIPHLGCNTHAAGEQQQATPHGAASDKHHPFVSGVRGVRSTSINDSHLPALPGGIASSCMAIRAGKHVCACICVCVGGSKLFGVLCGLTDAAALFPLCRQCCQ